MRFQQHYPAPRDLVGFCIVLVFAAKRNLTTFLLTRDLPEPDGVLMMTQFNYEALLDASPDAIVILDNHDHIQLVNRAAVGLLQASLDSLIGQSVTTLPGGDSYSQRAKDRMQVNRFAINPISEELEDDIEWTATIGQCSLKFQAARLLDQNAQKIGVWIGIKKNTAEITAQQILVSWGSDIALWTHSIRGYAALLLMDDMESLNEQQRKYVEVIQQSTDELIAYSDEAAKRFHDAYNA